MPSSAVINTIFPGFNSTVASFVCIVIFSCAMKRTFPLLRTNELFGPCTALMPWEANVRASDVYANAATRVSE